MKSVLHPILAAGILTLAGCFNSPTGPVGFDDFDSDPSAGISISHGQISTLSSAEFEIKVSDETSSLLNGVDATQIEFRHADVGTGEWEASTMVAEGSRYRATHTFMSSGEYLWRIVEAGNGATQERVLYESPGRMNVDRAHTDVGDYRVEYESYPGHVREGMTAVVSFWVFGSDGYDHEGMGGMGHCGDDNHSDIDHHGDDDHSDGDHHGDDDHGDDDHNGGMGRGRMGGMDHHGDDDHGDDDHSDFDHHGDDDHSDVDHHGDDCDGDGGQGDDYHHGDDGHGGMGQNWVAGLETEFGSNYMGGHMRGHSMREDGQGRYSAEYLFEKSGEAQLNFQFRGQGGRELATEFRVPVLAR